jgi:TonB family protein
MADLKNDIRKYLKGEMSQVEMHAFEKRALNDPFLSEALEGVGTFPAENFESDLTELEKRLESREARRTWIAPLRIAASIAFLLISSYLIYTFIKTDEPVTIAQTKPVESPVPPVKNQDENLNTKSAQEKTDKAPPLTQSAPAQPRRKEQRGAIPLLEPSKPLETSSASGDAAKAGPGDDAKEAKIQDLAGVTNDQKAAVPEQESIITLDKDEVSRQKKKDHLGRASRTINSADTRALQPTQNTISGRITATEDDTPITGANVLIKGTTEGAISDANGNYQLITTVSQRELVVSSIGYGSQEVKVPEGQAQVNVQLPADAGQLNEVVVVGYGADKKEEESERGIPTELAEPQGGRRAYQKYLEKNLRYPAQALEKKIEGKVTIEFTVQADGKFSQFNVIKGLESGCDEEVIRLVKEGPSWKPSAITHSTTPSRVRIQVKFKLP